MNGIFKKSVEGITLLIFLIFGFLALFAHFVLQRLSFQDMVLSVLFCGAGATTQVIVMATKQTKWGLDINKLSKKQVQIISVCSLIFGVCVLWLALLEKVNFILKAILLIGFFFFGIGGILLLRKTKNT